ncbi:MAG: bifunctional folylpolyglutamate synthase/dihydrofolate synthase [Cyclobacteriaceae bacterium]|nr:bifunctional folylpolyglutamate synthase/dihydrofolate synthase [Cyclobacteriaceae bacterium]
MYQRIGAAAYKDTLDNTIRLCEALGNPERKFKSIHIAGTNGKGSTSHMLAAILQSAGYRTGLYTSPHLKSFTERIRIDGHEVSKKFVVDFVEEMKPTLDEIEPSFFEMTVGMAFDYFAQEQVDIAVIEVGLGGRLDSTNVITPELSLITNISFDHMALLGNTLPKIAFEKAGIIKQGVPVIISERQEAVEDVFITRASHLHADLTFASDSVQLQEGSAGFDVYQNGSLWLEALDPGLKGMYQIHNLPGVLAAVTALKQKNYRISDAAVHTGVKHVASLTGLKGRWQVINQQPLTVCDTGHNEAGIREVVQQIGLTPHHRLHMIIGMVNDKDVSGVLGLLPREASYIFCQANIPRAMDAVTLQHHAKEAGLSGKVIKDVNEAIREVTSIASADDMIFVGGSTFVVAEVDNL